MPCRRSGVIGRLVGGCASSRKLLGCRSWRRPPRHGCWSCPSATGTPPGRDGWPAAVPAWPPRWCPVSGSLHLAPAGARTGRADTQRHYIEVCCFSVRVPDRTRRGPKRNHGECPELLTQVGRRLLRLHRRAEPETVDVAEELDRLFEEVDRLDQLWIPANVEVLLEASPYPLVLADVGRLWPDRRDRSPVSRSTQPAAAAVTDERPTRPPGERPTGALVSGRR